MSSISHHKLQFKRDRLPKPKQPKRERPRPFWYKKATLGLTELENQTGGKVHG